jgi:YihY family inner membrane protein
MGRLQHALRHADDVQQRHPWLAFPSAVIRKFSDDRAGGLAALIAYYGFFSLFPLMLVVVTVASYVLQGNEDLQLRIVDSALAQFPVIGGQIRDNVGSLTGSAFALAVGIGAALWAGMAVLASVQTAMDEIWDVPRRDRGALIPRLIRGSIVLLSLGAAVLVAALAAGVSTGLGSFAAVVAGSLIAAILNVTVMLVVFRVLTAAPVSWRDVLPGAVLAGVVWTGLQAVGGYIVDNKISGAGDVYGLFAVVIGLLSWLYLGAQLTLMAAELNVVLRRQLWPRSLFPPPTGPPDERALTLQAQQEEALGSERVSVEFDRGTRSQRVEDSRSG